MVAVYNMSKWELLVGVSGAAAKNSPVYILVYREDILGLNDKFVNIARILHRLLVVLLRLVVVQQHRHQEGGVEEGQAIRYVSSNSIKESSIKETPIASLPAQFLKRDK